MSATKTNLIIIASTSPDFLLPTIDRLYKVGQLGVKIEVFGHPSWSKAQFLNAEKMQWLESAENFIGARKLRNLLVHEYMADAELFLQALLAAREAAEMLFHTVTAIDGEAVAIRLNKISL